MRQSIKMKKTLNKSFFGILFVLGLGLLLIPQHKVDATYALVMEMNGGGGGGGGGGTTTTVTTNEISLNVSFNQSTPYTGSNNMVISSTASVSVCSNTSFNLRVKANITKVGTPTYLLNLGNLLDQGAVGGQVIAGTKDVTAPTASGTDYKLNVTAERYDPSGNTLKDFSGNTLSGVLDYQVVVGGYTNFYITTNYRGRITKVMSEGSEVSIEYIKYSSIKDIYGNTMTVPAIGEDIVKTYSSVISFAVGTPTVTVTKSSQAAIPSGTKDTVTWNSTYSNKCICYNEAAYTTRCKNEAGSDVPSAKSGTFITGVLTSDKTYYFKCDNL